MKAGLLLLALCLGTVADAAPQVRIALLPEARPAGDTVLLGEVAHLQAADLDLMRQLVALPLGRAPRGGQQGWLHQQGIAAWVQSQLGLAPQALAWEGAQEVRVQRPLQRVRGEALAQAAVDAVEAALRAGGGSAEVQVRVPPRDLELEAADLKLQARPPQAAQLRRRALVWVDVLAGASVLRSVPVSLEIARAEGEGPSRHGAGAPVLTSGDVVVARGEWAVLRALAGAVALEMRVEVLQDGRAGDRVRVRPAQGGGALLARVAGPGLLEVAP